MTQRTITVEDFARFKLVGKLTASPKGRTVLFEEQTTALKDDEYHTQIKLADLETGRIRPFASNGKRNTLPKWAPDGSKVAFLSDRELGTQIWTMPADGGEAVRLTRFRHGIADFAWAPDNRSIFALVYAGPHEDVSTYAQDVKTSDIEESIKSDEKSWSESPKRYNRLYYKSDGAGLSKLRYTQLVQINLDTLEFRQLTHGDESLSNPTPSPDGRYVLFTKGRDPDTQWWFSDLYKIDLASREIQLVSDELIYRQVVYSPNGDYLAALAMDQTFYEYRSASHIKLYLLTTDGKIISHLTADFPDDLTDSSLTDLRANVADEVLRWSVDSDYIYVLSTREGKSEVVRFDVAGDSPQGEIVIGGLRDIYAFDIVTDSTIAFAYATQTNPSTLSTATVHVTPHAVRPGRSPWEPMSSVEENPVPWGDNESVLYDPNKAFLLEVELSIPEPYFYQSTDDWWVQGWVMRPTGFEDGKKYPVILEIHGGPQLNFGYAMFHEMQWFAAQGYAVVYTNPRGGKSYGQTFVNAVRHHYGEGDAADVVNGLDAALKTYDFLDGSRVAVTGGSYGGFMTNWLVGHTNRFFAAVSQRSISNWISFFGCSDIGPLFVESQLVDSAEGNLARLWEMSPLAYVQNVETPILMLHSEQDLRCPIEQAEQFYTWLRRSGKDAELLRIPNASHGLSRNGKPSLRVKRLQSIFSYIHHRLPEPNNL
ncbi:S9 family peptidase [Alicyclobacillus dauci]|uniref:S9 family peptidase n=1 Tax=Alicyclobacillus dauci TaxID=1475485 RepID=A0ABY6YX57_9BACL|nr:S9 family peptidase [Alicyclobacillus dauci]WAH35160.1 S9 family peptidase [Alicyclobacillus dauci]